MFLSSIKKYINDYLEEDDLFRNDFYWSKLPEDIVECSLKFKTESTLLAGLPYFFSVFEYLGEKNFFDHFKKYEGTVVGPNTLNEITFPLKFSVALTGERLALNLLQKASSVATYTKKFVDLATPQEIAVLDTRKTTPGLRFLDKYAVRIGGGHNHRYSQTDSWMIKDNHKEYFGGVEGAYNFFKSMQGFYTPIILEVHSLTELEEAIKLNIKHIMLDNFTPELIKEAVKIKPSQMTFEVSGGISLQSLETYLIKGIDAISVGQITYNAPAVDVSFKYKHL